jgi:hypothetical protein
LRQPLFDFLRSRRGAPPRSREILEHITRTIPEPASGEDRCCIAIAALSLAAAMAELDRPKSPL